MQKKRVLILGATGMLGHMVYRYFEQLGTYELFNSVYRTPLNESSIVCNVKDQDALASLFDRTRPEIVINCIGALVQESKENPTSAIYLNALLPHVLKVLCNQYQAKLIHISTDCVFSGKKGGYAEDDFRDADDVYGRSKALGEILDEPHCTLRTSIIGPELKNGTGLFHWIMHQKGEVKGYTKAYWSGVTTLELAKAIHKAITNDLRGLFHVTNGVRISKFELLKMIQIVYAFDQVLIKEDCKYQMDKSLQKSIKFDFEVLSYSLMLKEMFELNG